MQYFLPSSKFLPFPKALHVFLIGSTIAFSITACQPTDNVEHETAEHTDTMTQAEGEHDEHEHEEEMHHDEHEHEEEMHHDEHEHDEEMHHDEHEHDEEMHHDEHDEHAGHQHEANRIFFTCEPSKSISAYYHDDDTPKTAHLLIDDIEYDLSEVANLPKQTFASPIGMEDGTGIVWQVMGDEATLSTVPTSDLSSAVSLDNAAPLYNCHKAS